MKSEWGPGLQLQEILKFKNKDIRDKDSIEANIGTKNIKRTFVISPELKKIIHEYTEGKDPDAYLILGHASSPSPPFKGAGLQSFKKRGEKYGSYVHRRSDYEKDFRMEIL